MSGTVADAIAVAMMPPATADFDPWNPEHTRSPELTIQDLIEDMKFETDFGLLPNVEVVWCNGHEYETPCGRAMRLQRKEVYATSKRCPAGEIESGKRAARRNRWRMR